MDRPPSNAVEIRKIRRYVRNAETEVNKLGIIPRNANRYPFDHVGLQTLSKAFALSKACLELLDSGFPDEAYGLSRSLVECAANLRYLTIDQVQEKQRTRNFVKYAKTAKAYWMYQALQIADAKKQVEIREYAKQQGIVEDARSALRHWSGENGSLPWVVALTDHRLDAPTVSSTQRKIAYAADYHDTSAFVHCSLPAIDPYNTEEYTPFRVAPSSGMHNTNQHTLTIILTYLHASIAYVLFGINTERPAKLNSLFMETLKKMKRKSSK
jgi:Family of unknown function (DUF5677)